MTPEWLSPLSKFTPVPSHGSIFVYTIPPQNVMPARVTQLWVHPGSCTGARISLWYETLQRYHVNSKRPPVSVWNRSAGRLEREAWHGIGMALFSRIICTCTFSKKKKKIASKRTLDYFRKKYPEYANNWLVSQIAVRAETVNVTAHRVGCNT